MKQTSLSDMTTPALVERFADIGVAQDAALLEFKIAKFNRLFDQMCNVEAELKSRDGDQRRALAVLYRYPNMQVRLNAARATLAVAPVEARRQIEEIAGSKWFPQAGDAGMCLRGLDDGTYRPK